MDSDKKIILRRPTRERLANALRDAAMEAVFLTGKGVPVVRVHRTSLKSSGIRLWAGLSTWSDDSGAGVREYDLDTTEGCLRTADGILGRIAN